MPSRSASANKKRSTGSESSTATNVEDQIEKAQADSTTSADGDGHPVYGDDKKWNSGDRVLCRYMHAENIYYEAKVIGLKQKEGESAYSIHYPGWSSRHDETVPHSQALLRFKDYTNEDAQKAKEEIKRAQQATAKKRKSKAEESRSSTPSGEISGKRKPGTSRSRVLGAGEGQERKKDLPQVVIPDALRRILIDDENLINKSYFLPKVPARVTVYDIVQKYREFVSPSGVSRRENYVETAESTNSFLNPTSENLERSALGILDYFETAVGRILLYKFERPMFNDMHEQLQKEKAEETENEGQKGGAKAAEEVKPELKRVCYSKQFGLPHLMRMFVRFSDMLGYTEWSDRSLEAIIRHATDFVLFVNQNHQEFFNVDEDYELASAEYHKRVWGNQS